MVVLENGIFYSDRLIIAYSNETEREMMFIKLEKEGKVVEYKIGPAKYIILELIPIVGYLIVLVISIQVKQFRGYYLNKMLLGLVIGPLFIILMSAGFDTGNKILYLIGMMVEVIFTIAIVWNYVHNANYYSIKQRLSEGYTVLNDDEEQVVKAVEKAKETKLHFWQITSF